MCLIFGHENWLLETVNNFPGRLFHVIRDRMVEPTRPPKWASPPEPLEFNGKSCPSSALIDLARRLMFSTRRFNATQEASYEKEIEILIFSEIVKLFRR
jgi:hypothetical protein